MMKGIKLPVYYEGENSKIQRLISDEEEVNPEDLTIQEGYFYVIDSITPYKWLNEEDYGETTSCLSSGGEQFIVPMKVEELRAKVEKHFNS